MTAALDKSFENNPKKKFSTGRLICREKAPYITAALLGLIPRHVEGLGTFGVTDNGFLLWDKEVVARWSLEEIAAVLYHEVWHFLRDHGARQKAMGADGRLFNIAADAEINDDIKKPNWSLPDDPIMPATIQCEEGKSAEFYYAYLRDNPDVAGEMGQEPGWGMCGSGAGNALPDEPKGKGKSKGDQDKDGKGEGDSEGDGDGQGEGDGGQDIDKGRSKQDMERMRRQVAQAVQSESAKSRGDMPAGMSRWADATLEPAKVRWQDKLGAICRGAVAYKAGAVDYAYAKPSRRQYGVGFGIGKPILPSMRQPIPNVLIAVDTSGSMGQSELEDAMRETNGILSNSGANVSFTSCDARMGSVTHVRNWKEAALEMVGGGGTSFCPVFEAVPSMKMHPDIIVFITDGCGPAPDEPPARSKTIWLLVGQHASIPWADGGGGKIEWGEFIWHNDECQKRSAEDSSADEDEY